MIKTLIRINSSKFTTMNLKIKTSIFNIKTSNYEHQHPVICIEKPCIIELLLNGKRITIATDTATITFKSFIFQEEFHHLLQLFSIVKAVPQNAPRLPTT